MIKRRETVEKFIENQNGILRLRPAFIARKGLPSGRRLGLPEEEYNKGERGEIIARCLASETTADTPLGPPDEGLSYLDIDGENITLKEAVNLSGEMFLGKERAEKTNCIGLLAKVFDFKCRLYYHIHLMEKDAALVGKKPKEETYYFLEDAPTGTYPETFFGVHPCLVEQNIQYETLLPYLEDWNSDLILKHSKAYMNVPGEGFHLPAGGLHAPGTALTLELQEPSDVFSVLQAKIGDIRIDKSLLHKDIPDDRWNSKHEASALDLADWELNGDPYFYENRHLTPIKIQGSVQTGGFEEWISYNTHKFSAKKLTVYPGKTYKSRDKGIYTFFVWKGSGSIDGVPFTGKDVGNDELLVVHEKAASELVIRNEGKEELIIFKLYGPGINKDVPFLKRYIGGFTRL